MGHMTQPTVSSTEGQQLVTPPGKGPVPSHRFIPTYTNSFSSKIHFSITSSIMFLQCQIVKLNHNSLN